MLNSKTNESTDAIFRLADILSPCGFRNTVTSNIEGKVR